MKFFSFIKFFILFVLTYFLQYCAPSRYVKPLEKKQSAAVFSFGGPLIKFGGAPIPIPFSTLGYGYGLSNDVTVYGNLHSTSLLFANAQADIGATLHLYKKQNVFGITASPALQLAYNIRNQTGFRIWPSLDLNTYFHFNKKPSYGYGGVNSWLEPSKLRAHGEPQQRQLIPNLQIGYVVVKTKWQHQFECKYLGIGVPNLPGVVDYIGIAHKGTFGIYYSLTMKF
ncbi:MAG TPA: hypothetical protein PL029_10825 [Bacteroidia bacterium]|nr:hypothetical protein [Bacteroidia bacterium]